jgi:outer membrane lipoprotein-sorting protein
MKSLLLLFAALSLAVAQKKDAAAPPADASLDAVMARIDEASVGFRSLTANVRKLSHTDVVSVDEVSSGTVQMKRYKAQDTRVCFHSVAPEEEIDLIAGNKFFQYKPKSNVAQEAELGKYRGLVDQFMLLGFGSNSAQIRNAYSVTLGGADSVNGERTTRIVLVPKDREAQKKIPKCELWVSAKGLVLQQKFYQGGGDYFLATYSSIVLNPAIADSAFKIDLPKGMKFDKLK